MKKTALLLAIAALLACFLLALGQQLFEGELQVLDFPAPEFPAPSQPANPLPDEGARAQPASPPGQLTPEGGIGEQNAGAPSQPMQSAAQPDALPSNGIYWINSRPLYIHSLRGRVVMLDLWEYTCINCIRTLPTTIAWYNKYRPYGFEVIGVHGPEFRIAYNVDNVRRAVKRFHIPYPVVVDDQFRIFQAYHANAWPVRYLIDARGIVRYERVGEGGDAAFEDAIRQLLTEAHPGVKLPPKHSAASEDAFSPGCGGETPEMYVGDWEGRGTLGNEEGYSDGKIVDYKLPGSVEDGRFVLGGRWKTDANGMIYAAKKGSPGGELEVRYHARELYSVLNVSHGRPSRLYITQDGKDLTAGNKGEDVELDSNGRSYVEVRESRMYYLVRNPSDSAHVLVLRPSAPGITINSFTFGNNCQLDFAHL